MRAPPYSDILWLNTPAVSSLNNILSKIGIINFKRIFSALSIRRWHDFVFGCAQLIRSCNHVQLLFRRTIWTGSSTEAGERQEKYYRYSNGKCPVADGILFSINNKKPAEWFTHQIALCSIPDTIHHHSDTMRSRFGQRL